MAPPSAQGINPHGIEAIVTANASDYTNELYVVGVVIESVLFGFCLATTGLCLYYMIRRWSTKTSPISQYIETPFLLLLLAYNIVVFAINVAGALRVFHWVLGYLQTSPTTGPLIDSKASNAFEVAFVPTFLWISDAFLIWRCWVIWTGHRWFVVIPGAVWLASVVTGILWSVEGTQHLFEFASFQTNSSDHLTDAIVDWIPATAFSCGLDLITTSMIAGRLLYYHRKQRKTVSSLPSNLYISIVAICIESAILSTFSKFIQLFVPGVKIYSYAVVPLCTIASSLILLRKALGADVASIGQSLSGRATPGFRPGHRRDFSGSTVIGSEVHSRALTSTNACESLPAKFDNMLVEAVGGKVLDIAGGTGSTVSDDPKSPVSSKGMDEKMEKASV